MTEPEPVTPDAGRPKVPEAQPAPARAGPTLSPGMTAVAGWPDRRLVGPAGPEAAPVGDAPRGGRSEAITPAAPAMGQPADATAKARPAPSALRTPPTRPEDPAASAEMTIDALADAGGASGFGLDTAALRPGERTHASAQIAHLPAGFGHRLAEAVAASPDRPVEITLSPEELGRVRMTLTTEDGALTLAILADRPDTIELMRRHIDQLAQDFRDLGFSDVSFDFGRHDDTPAGRRDAEPAAATDAVPGTAPATGHPTPARPAPRPDADGGLDLRL